MSSRRNVIEPEGGNNPWADGDFPKGDKFRTFRAMIRKNVYTGTPWESKVAYCRAKRVGKHVFVSGTVAVDETGVPVGVDDLYAQSIYALRKIERALRELGADLHHVVRTRTFVTDIRRFEEFARAHRECFVGIDPVATCVEVARLVLPELLVEIEVDALLEFET